MEILTRQEKRIAKLVAEEMAEKQIADVLNISPTTVHTHTKNIRRKLGVKSAVGIAVKYLQSLEHPRRFAVAMMFLFLQLGIIVSANELDFRRSRIARRAAKTRIQTAS